MNKVKIIRLIFSVFANIQQLYYLAIPERVQDK